MFPLVTLIWPALNSCLHPLHCSAAQGLIVSGPGIILSLVTWSSSHLAPSLDIQVQSSPLIGWWVTRVPCSFIRERALKFWVVKVKMLYNDTQCVTWQWGGQYYAKLSLRTKCIKYDMLVWCVVCGNLKKTLIRMSEVSVWLDHSGPFQRRCDSHRRCLRCLCVFC